MKAGLGKNHGLCTFWYAQLLELCHMSCAFVYILLYAATYYLLYIFMRFDRGKPQKSKKTEQLWNLMNSSNLSNLLWNDNVFKNLAIKTPTEIKLNSNFILHPMPAFARWDEDDDELQVLNQPGRVGRYDETSFSSSGNDSGHLGVLYDCLAQCLTLQACSCEEWMQCRM